MYPVGNSIYWYFWNKFGCPVAALFSCGVFLECRCSLPPTGSGQGLVCLSVLGVGLVEQLWGPVSADLVGESGQPSVW